MTHTSFSVAKMMKLADEDVFLKSEFYVLSRKWPILKDEDIWNMLYLKFVVGSPSKEKQYNSL